MPFVAWGSGFEPEYPDNGAHALGRAGAFTARADDPTAVYYNPAGLSKQSGREIYLAANTVWMNYNFQPADEIIKFDHEISFGKIRQQEDPVPVPMLFGHFDFESLPKWDFGFGIYGPPTVKHRRFPNPFPVAGVQRNGVDTTDSIRGEQSFSLWPNGMLIESDLLLAYPSLAVSYQILPNLSVGVSLQAALFQGTMSIAIGGTVPGQIDLDVADWFTPTGILGVQYAPIPSIELGASIRPPYEIKAKGTASIHRFEETCPNGGTECEAGSAETPLGPWKLGNELPLYAADGSKDDGVTMGLHAPMQVRFGGRYVNRLADGSERFDVEFDYLFEMQSMHDAIDLVFDADHTIVTAGDGELPPISLPEMSDKRNYVNTHAFRLGGDYNVIPNRLALRLGGSYETSQSESKYTHLDFVSNDRWSVAAGAGVKVDWLGLGWKFDVAYSYVGLIERNVKNSDVRLVDISYMREDWPVRGNGKYSGDLHVLGASASISF